MLTQGLIFNLRTHTHGQGCDRRFNLSNQMLMPQAAAKARFFIRRSSL
jgi:hypothetical protein